MRGIIKAEVVRHPGQRPRNNRPAGQYLTAVHHRSMFNKHLLDGFGTARRPGSSRARHRTETFVLGSHSLPVGRDGEPAGLRQPMQQLCPDTPSNKGKCNASHLLERLVFRLGLVSLVRRYISTVFEPRKLGLYLPCASEIRYFPRKEAFDILDTRYAKGEITLLEYNQMKSEISKG